MIVVPSLAHCDERDERIVPTLITGVEPFGTKQMIDRIDCKSCVVEGDGRYYESPDQKHHAIHTGDTLKGCNFTQKITP